MKRSLGARTLSMPAPVWVVGTYDAAGRPNMMTAAWTGICCSEPPCVYVSVRKSRYTHGNLVARQAFTLGIPSQAHVAPVDYWGLASGRDGDKIAPTGLTVARAAQVDAPYIEEFPIIMECRLRQAIELGSHTQFIGEVLDVRVDEDRLSPSGMPDGGKLDLFVLLDGYRAVGPLIGRAFSVGKEELQRGKK